MAENDEPLEQGSGELQARLAAVLEAAIRMNSMKGGVGPQMAQNESAD